MACGIPVIATRVGGIPEIAAEGGVVLVEPNSPEALANAIQSLVEDENLRAQTASEGLASFKRRYTWEAVCVQYEGVATSVSQTKKEEGARHWQ